MKNKRFGFFAAALCFCALFMTACSSSGSDSGIESLFAGTYNQWYKYNGSAQIPLGAADDDTEGSNTSLLKSVELYCKFNPAAGLTIAVQASKEQNIEVFNGLGTTTANVTMGGTKEYGLDKFGMAKWIAVYSAVNLKSSSTPKIVSNPDECIKLDNFDNFKIQWKKVLANLLVNKLLGE